MHPKRHRGITQLVQACFNSAAGLRDAWKNEEAFRQEAALASILVPAAFWLGENSVKGIASAAVGISLVMLALVCGVISCTRFFA